MNHKLCLIIPYFGEWPKYYKIYLNSCKENLELDILIFTDLMPTGREPVNVKIIPFSIDKFKNLIREKLLIEPQLNSNYKLCDFRPAYGMLFTEYLDGYDFWGWGDLDVIYGKIRNYLNNEILDNYDVISFRAKWLSGSFTLLRNTGFLKNLFQSNEDYKKVFTDHKHYAFDECNKNWNQLRNGASIESVSQDLSNMTSIVLDAKKQRKIKCLFKDRIKESIGKRDYIKYFDSRIFDSKKSEYLLYHYVTEKRNPLFAFPSWKEIPSNFYVDQYGFYLIDEFENKTLNVLHFIRKLKGIPQLLKHYWNRVKNKLILNYEP